MSKIIGVHYTDDEITKVKLDDNSIISISDAISMAESGKIEDVNVGAARSGRKTLRSYPDGDASNNLANLPKF